MRFKQKLYPFLMLLPFILVILIFFVIPVILTVVMSFTDMGFTLEWNFVGFKNFDRIFNDHNIPEILKNTAVYVIFTLCINVFGSLLLALLTAYFITRRKHELLYRSLWMLPRMTPSTIMIFMWLWLLSPTGFLNRILEWFGAEKVNWLVEYPMVFVVIVNGCVGVSFGMLIFASAIKTIPNDVFLSAQVDGAKDWAIVREIILPAIKWQIMYVSISQLLALMNSYEHIMLLTSGGPLYSTTVWSLYAYIKAFRSSEFGYGATLSLILVTASLCLTVLMLKGFKFNKMMRETRID